MKIPPNKTEAEVLEIIAHIVKLLADKFKFGYMDAKDIEQEGTLFAMKALEKYDHTRPLENFLYTHVRNRLVNFKRDNYRRHEPPCIKCPFYDKLCKQSDNQCAAFKNKLECDKFKRWFIRNNTRQNLMYPVDINNVYDERISHEASPDRIVESRELVELISKQIPEHLKDSFNKLSQGEKIKEADRLEIQKIAIKVVGDDYDCGN